MNQAMGISRSCEEGMYLLREGDGIWRVHKNGAIDCAAQGSTRLFEVLDFLQKWKTSSRRTFLNYPLQ